MERAEEVCWLYNKQTPPGLWSRWGRRKKQTHTSHTSLFIREGTSRGQRLKQLLISMIKAAHATLTVQLFLHWRPLFDLFQLLSYDEINLLCAEWLLNINSWAPWARSGSVPKLKVKFKTMQTCAECVQKCKVWLESSLNRPVYFCGTCIEFSPDRLPLGLEKWAFSSEKPKNTPGLRLISQTHTKLWLCLESTEKLCTTGYLGSELKM